MVATTPQPARVMVPQEAHGTLLCPRCSGRLLHDGANLLCVLCGYEFGVAQFIARRSQERREAACRPLSRVA